VRQLTDNVYVDIGPGRCNPSFVVTGEGVFMVDSPELPKDALAWREQIARFGEPKYLANLEHHDDHIIGNHFFSPPAVIVSHQGTRDQFIPQLKSPAHVRERIARMDPEGLPVPDDYQLKPPTLTYTDRATFYLGDQEIQVHHLPGHTPNQSVVFVPRERVMMAGGNLSCEIMPAMWGSEILNWLKALEQMDAMQPEHIIPVHGPLADRAYLRTFKGVLEAWVEDVRQAIARGWTKQEAAERINYLGPFRMRPGREQFGSEWQEWNTIAIYEELTGEPPTPRTYFQVGRYPKEALGR
jgi:cyclase